MQIYDDWLKIDHDKEISELDKLYQDVISALKNPVDGLPTSHFEYHIDQREGNVFYIGKFWRNCALVYLIRDLILKHDYVLMSLEYFRGELKLERIKGKKLTEPAKQIFFLEYMLMAFFSVLDILAKSISWYYNLDGKDEQGFNYGFIKELKKVNAEMADKLLKFFNSDDTQAVRKYRNDSAHTIANVSMDSPVIRIDAGVLSVTRRDEFEMVNFTKSLFDAYQEAQTLIKECLVLFSSTPLGYDSPSDMRVVVEPKTGRYIGL